MKFLRLLLAGRAKIGLTFASAMRRFLKVDPDVTMIVEIRDQKTARIAIQAVIDGASGAVDLAYQQRLRKRHPLAVSGDGRAKFADSLICTFTHRRFRTLRRQCAEEGHLTHAELDALVLEYTAGSPFDKVKRCQRLLAAAGVASFDQLRIKKPVGCKACDAKGYRGSLGICEIQQNSPAMRILSQHNARPP